MWRVQLQLLCRSGRQTLGVTENNQFCSRALTMALEVTTALAFAARGKQLLFPKGRKEISALSSQQPRLPAPTEGTSSKELACKEEQGNH